MANLETARSDASRSMDDATRAGGAVDEAELARMGYRQELK